MLKNNFNQGYNILREVSEGRDRERGREGKKAESKQRDMDGSRQAGNRGIG